MLHALRGAISNYLTATFETPGALEIPILPSKQIKLYSF